MPRRLAAGPLGLIGLLAVGLGTAAGEAPDWPAVSEVREVTALTTDEDGSPRETTIWLVVVGGEGFIRTSRSTTWGDNVEREGVLSLRLGKEDREYALRAEFIEDGALRESVTQAFRDKYGFSDALIGWFRGADPRIMRLHAR